MALNVTKPQHTNLKPTHATVPQLLALARQDTDRVSVFVDGSTWDDADAAILVIKGGRLARDLVSMFERQGLITPGKGVTE